jgi:phosphatidylinositol-3,4,5-trisphosphate 3-phosphatase/dual-specificity protein phosphatase PTEN
MTIKHGRSFYFRLAAKKNFFFFIEDICDKIIAMGLPAKSLFESIARNPLDEVSSFLKEAHKGNYKIYNL